MPQAPNIAPTFLHLCRVRLTRLTDTGAVSGSTNNSYVTGNPIQLTATPDILTGTSSDLMGGCDCPVVTYRGRDKLRRFTLQLQLGAVEPALMELLTGATLITDASDVPVPIGLEYNDQVNCTAPQSPNLALEAWSDNWQNDAQVATPFRYTHHLWPSTHWQPDATTLQNDFSVMQFNAFTRSNPLWGTGPYTSDAAPISITKNYAFWFTDAIPDAALTYGIAA